MKEGEIESYLMTALIALAAVAISSRIPAAARIVFNLQPAPAR